MTPTFSTRLSDAHRERLVILAEECAEVVQAVSKALRHGYESTYPGTAITNRAQIEREIGDVLAVCNLLVLGGDLDIDRIEEARKAKLNRIHRYLHFQVTAEQMTGETVTVPPSDYAAPPEAPPTPDTSLNDRARQIAAYANKCCGRGDGYEDDVALYALNHLLLAVAKPVKTAPEPDAGRFGGMGKKVIDDFFAWFGHDQDCMGNAAWDELARRIDLAILNAVEGR